jgi:SAM-dependent methyltransferase
MAEPLDAGNRPCPVCGSCDVAPAGPILHPVPTLVAGVPIDLTAMEFRLLRCRGCLFAFKDPVIPEERLLDCYRRAQRGHWGEDVDPRARYFDALLDVTTRWAPGRRVLDVGCFNGAMLQYFGDRWERYGVEPGAEAAALAESRGVRILSATLAQAPPEPAFDAIVAIDVLEHILDPLDFVHQVAGRLAPGGVFVGMTGDSDALSWRLQGSRYWYCNLPEHVSFYCRRSMQQLASRCGLTSVEHLRTSHDRTSMKQKVVELVKNLGYIVGNRTGGLGLKPLRRLLVDRRAPGWMTAKDHMIHVMQRPAAPATSQVAEGAPT